MTTRYRLYFRTTLVDVLDIDADSDADALTQGWLLYDTGTARSSDLADMQVVRSLTCRPLTDEEVE